jgi:hypothetical protein
MPGIGQASCINREFFPAVGVTALARNLQFVQQPSTGSGPWICGDNWWHGWALYCWA